MLHSYDLYDLHSIFVAIRAMPDNEINHEVISSIIKVLKNRHNNNGLNQFRIALQTIDSLNNVKLYDFAFVENKYSYFPLPALKDENIYLLLITACEKLLEAIVEKNSKKIYDLADCLHDLPTSIVENKYKVPKWFWKKAVVYYRKKWDKTFLVEEEKSFKKHRFNKFLTV